MEGRKLLVLAGVEHTEKCVQHAIIAENAGHIVLSVWGDSIEKMEDGQSVKVMNAAINHFQGVKSTTMTDTETRNVSEQFDVDWTHIENREQEVQLICYEIAAVELKKFKICANLGY